jgi:hypothetical protein
MTVMKDFENDFKKDAREKKRKGKFDSENDRKMTVTEELKTPTMKTR